MAYKEDRLALFFEFFKFVIAFCLEKYISYGKGLIHDQDLRIDIDGHGKSQTDKHTAGIGFHRLIDKLTDIGKSQDLRKTFLDLLFRKAEHGTVEIHILHTGILHIKAGT